MKSKFSSGVRWLGLIALGLALFATAQACSAQAQGGMDTTVIRINPDGTYTMNHYMVSWEDYAEEVRVRKDRIEKAKNGIGVVSSAISNRASDEPNCDADDLWLFSGTNCPQTGQIGTDWHRLCFYGAGTATLTGCPWCPQYDDNGAWKYWRYNVRSFEPGNSSGHLFWWNVEEYYTYFSNYIYQGCTNTNPGPSVNDVTLDY